MSDNDNSFSIQLEGFNEGFSPLAHIDSKTFVGGKGQASEMKADVISLPGFLTQSPALANLTNGSQAGVVDQLIRHILDKPTAADVTFALGTTKLFKLSSTAVISGGTPSWPQTVTNMTEGESVIRLKANLYAFYNKTSGGDIAQMPLATETIDPDWGSTNDVALENAPHPSAAKEDVLVFGNGRYLGVYVEGAASLNVKKLDFGEGSEVADVIFHSNVWWIAVNFGEGKSGEVFMYDGSAISNVLADEVAVGNQKIGFLYVQNGVIYIAYDDKSSVGFAIGWLNGRTIKPLRYFPGALPNHRQKTLYKNTLLFISTTDIWSVGAPVEQLPVQISKLADAGYATVGALACPFGVPMVASSESTNFRLAKFSGYSTDSNWKSIMLDLSSEKDLGKINSVIIATKALVGSAKAEITIEGNQGALTSNTLTVQTANKTRHVFNVITLGAVEDIRVIVSFANADPTNYCPIRKITLLGSFVER
jgi:hypothetical protein